MVITLNKFIPINEIDGNFLRNSFFQVGLPTEMVISKAEIKVPTFARVYSTDFYVYANSVYSYQDLVKKLKSEKKVFNGTNEYPDLLMTEVWIDCGDDGHINMKMIGYRFVSSDDWDEHEKEEKKQQYLGINLYMGYMNGDSNV